MTKHETNSAVTGAPSVANPTIYDRARLITQWQRYYGGKPPKGISRQTLGLATSYHKQAREHGGLPRGDVKQLHKIARSKQGSPLLPMTARQIKPGARLVREWHGKAYVVDILESGFLFNEKLYGSLTEIAEVITGTHWSGPRFFGVKG